MDINTTNTTIYTFPSLIRCVFAGAAYTTGSVMVLCAILLLSKLIDVVGSGIFAILLSFPAGAFAAYLFKKVTGKP